MSHQGYNQDFSLKKPLRLSRYLHEWLRTYFVIIHAQRHAQIFKIPELQTILEKIWKMLPERFPGLILGDFVIEPDHIRLILHLEGLHEKTTTLGRVIGTYKSLVAIAWLRYLDTVRTPEIALPSHIWQRNYHEYAIRDAPELERIWQSLRNHPSRSRAPDTNNPL